MDKKLTTPQAAEILKVSRTRVNKLCAAGALKAEKFGNAWMVDANSVRERAADPPASGRPKKRTS